MNTPKYMCPKCGDSIGYIGWAFTLLQLPLLKHVCSPADIARKKNQ